MVTLTTAMHKRQQAKEKTDTHAITYACIPIAMISSTYQQKKQATGFVVTVTAQPSPYYGNACLTTNKNHKHCTYV
jgi:hypothetical protein